MLAKAGIQGLYKHIERTPLFKGVTVKTNRLQNALRRFFCLPEACLLRLREQVFLCDVVLAVLGVGFATVLWPVQNKMRGFLKKAFNFSILLQRCGNKDNDQNYQYKLNGACPKAHRGREAFFFSALLPVHAASVVISHSMLLLTGASPSSVSIPRFPLSRILQKTYQSQKNFCGGSPAVFPLQRWFRKARYGRLLWGMAGQKACRFKGVCFGAGGQECGTASEVGRNSASVETAESPVACFLRSTKDVQPCACSYPAGGARL